MNFMKSVGSFEAKKRLAEILGEVSAGETYVVTKRGRPVARIVPVHSRNSSSEIINEHRRKWKRRGRGFITEEITEFKNEGRR